MNTSLLLALGLICHLPFAVHAKYMQPETKRVPTDRLVTNLQARIQADPKNLEHHYQLARVHSIAYATLAADFPVMTQGEHPFFGHGTSKDYPPSEVIQARPGQDGIAQGHLNNAIRHYRVVTTANTNHHFAQLGLGWCLDQSGDKPGARAAYRQALLLAWRLEQKAEGLEIGGCITDEVARYLYKLLDPVKDADEIKTIKGYVKALEKKGRWITPILVPLAAELALAELVNPAANIRFDLDGGGFDRTWGWITPKAAWLVFDHDGRGEITSGLQMFGSVTFWVFWQNGYHALASLDHDGDGVLRDDELRGLALWHDANSNGVSEPGEVKPLAAWGITALSCRYETHSTGIPFSPRGVVFKDGGPRPSYDWIAPGR